MSKSKKQSHTPGPWKVNEMWGLIVSSEGHEVAACHGGRTGQRDESKANAALIAASPELLSVLRDVLAMTSAELLETPGGKLVFDEAMKAIAKAEGRE